MSSNLSSRKVNFVLPAISDRDAPDESVESYEIIIEQPFYYVYNPTVSNWDRIGIGANSGPHSSDSMTSSRSKGMHSQSHITTEADAGIVHAGAPSSYILLSWNVDFMAAYESERLVAILDYIQRTFNDDEPPLLLLQEVSCDCFPALLAHPLTRAFYALSSISPDTWADSDASYGVVTLVPHRLVKHMRRMFRIPLQTSMYREALFVDFNLCPEGKNEPQLIRIANTHLESLREVSDVLRPLQLSRIARHLIGLGAEAHNNTSPDQDSTRGDNKAVHEVIGGGLHAGLVAGDMNPIGPADPDLPAQVGLLDAWEVQALRVGEKEEGWDVEDAKERAVVISGYTTVGNDEAGPSVFLDPTHGAGYTWGIQPHSYFPIRRMDKILYTRESCLRVDSVRRIGVGLKLRVRVAFDGSDFEFDGSSTQQNEGEEGDVEEIWATDHFGLVARITIKPVNGTPKEGTGTV